MNKLIKKISKLLNISEKEFSYREDGRIEWICKHGVGHTVYNPNNWGEYNYTHGCDGCCNHINPNELNIKLNNKSL